MSREDELIRENEALRHRLSRLTEASLRMNESLDFDVVLQGVLDSARSLTGARYGVMTLHDDGGQVQDFLSSGMTSEEAGALWDMSGHVRLYEYLGSISQPLRLHDLLGHIRSAGLPEFPPPLAAGPVISFLASPMLHRGERVGNIYLAEKEHGEEFTQEDEETLVMFASQATMVVSYARRYRDERQSRTDLETLIDTSPVGVVVFDARTGALMSFNREVRRIFEYLWEADQPLGELMKVLTIRRGDGQEISLQEFPLTQLLNDAETVRAEEIVVQMPDGRSVSALMNATPIRSEAGEVSSLVVTLQDMTPLEDLERLRAEFLATVSHELRTPLTSIKGSVTTLLDTSTALNPTETLQFHRIINSQTDRMRELISDLLDVARIDTGTLSVSPEPTDVAVLVAEVQNAFLSVRLGRKLQVDLSPDLPWVLADRLRILQVLNNLLSNADRHSDETSTIRVTAAREGPHVAISVTDEGRGVSVERLPHLFRKFTRIEGDARRNDVEGTGLGLSICKGIVEAHGGRIWAESDGPGMGARFTFTIPVSEESQTVATVSPASLPVRSSLEAGDARMRVLVVEDDPQALRYVRDVLSRAGYVPVATENPEEALRLAQSEKLRLALLDLVLPGIDGIDLMKKIRAVADVPVIFLSAYGRDEIVTRALDSGAVDYVVKPFSPTELVARIRVALRNQTASRSSEPFVLGELVIDYGRRSVTLGGSLVRLTAIEYRMLVELSANAGRVSTYDHLLQRVWGESSSSDLRPMRTALSSIRRKLRDDADNPTYIFTEPRIGYRMARSETSE
ncbi:MAG: response regulator [Dehalococcoidia bacterium]|nr:response regulator [Dehalococcoidia bacterium]